jgi:3D (Asp-Asp-Asp) domain-containing protein
MNKNKCPLPFACILCSIIFTVCLAACMCAAAPLRPADIEQTAGPFEESQIETEIESVLDTVDSVVTVPKEAQELPLCKGTKRLKQVKYKEIQQTTVPYEEVPEEMPEETEEPEKEPIVLLGDFIITHYCSCVECCDEWALNRPIVDGEEIIYTASGALAQEGVTIAVDPTKIPYGTVLYIEGIGYRVAQDCGGAITGNKIDVYMRSHETALSAGCFTAKVYMVTE